MFCKGLRMSLFVYTVVLETGRHWLSSSRAFTGICACHILSHDSRTAGWHGLPGGQSCRIVCSRHSGLLCALSAFSFSLSLSLSISISLSLSLSLSPSPLSFYFSGSLSPSPFSFYPRLLAHVGYRLLVPVFVVYIISYSNVLIAGFAHLQPSGR